MSIPVIKGNSGKTRRCTMRTGKSRVLTVMTMAVITVLLLTTGCIQVVVDGDGIVGSPNLVTREFDFSSFIDVEIGSAFEIDIIQSDTSDVTITLNENLFEYLDISQSGETLRILMETDHNYRQSTLHATISMPRLRTLKLLGAVQAKVTGFSTDQTMDFVIIGASTLELADVEAGDTRFNITGASRAIGSIKMADGNFEVSAASTIELEGEGTHMELTVLAASTARMEDFLVKTAEVHIIAASNATIEVSERLDIEVNSASRLVYGGDAALGSVQVSGASTLSRR